MLLLLMVTLNITLQTPHEEVHLKVKVPETAEERTIGLSRTKNLPASKGMLFKFEQEGLHAFTMKETAIPLALLFFNSKGALIEVIERDAFDPHLIFPSKPTLYVLEVNPNLLKDHLLPIMRTQLHFFKKTLDD